MVRPSRKGEHPPSTVSPRRPDQRSATAIDDGKPEGELAGLTILALLNRLRHDERYRVEEFSLGYWDRVAKDILELSLGEVDWDHSDKFALCRGSSGSQVGGARSRHRTLPLHRIRRVWRGSRLVWSRVGPEGEQPDPHRRTL